MPISEFWLHYWRQIIFFTVQLSNIIFFSQNQSKEIFFEKIPSPPRISNGPCLTSRHTTPYGNYSEFGKLEKASNMRMRYRNAGSKEGGSKIGVGMHIG